jgi:uncharacterized damage-inducible protein DinB
MMTDKNELVDLLAYNFWANQRLHGVFEKMDSGLADVPVVSSFKSLRLSLEHLAGAEVVWFLRLKGNAVTRFPVFDQNRFPDPAWMEASRNLLLLAEQSSLAFLNSDITYHNFKGENFNNKVSGIIKHVVNHGSFHRGQVVTILRTLGINTIPSTDYIQWLRTQ